MPVRPRVILVDDSNDLRELLRDCLVRRGCDVVAEAADGLEAIAMVDVVPCDRVVMDYRMPALDGVEATRVIARSWAAADVEIVGFTDADEACSAFLDAGAAAYYPKAHFTELLDHVARPV
jgi:DNA-binding NarL/FixJ family response regulator